MIKTSNITCTPYAAIHDNDFSFLSVGQDQPAPTCDPILLCPLFCSIIKFLSPKPHPIPFYSI